MSLSIPASRPRALSNGAPVVLPKAQSPASTAPSADSAELRDVKRAHNELFAENNNLSSALSLWKQKLISEERRRNQLIQQLAALKLNVATTKSAADELQLVLERFSCADNFGAGNDRADHVTAALGDVAVTTTDATSRRPSFQRGVRFALVSFIYGSRCSLTPRTLDDVHVALDSDDDDDALNSQSHAAAVLAESKSPSSPQRIRQCRTGADTDTDGRNSETAKRYRRSTNTSRNSLQTRRAL